MTQEFRQRFLSNRDDTGRFIIVSRITGIQYFIEPIGPRGHNIQWGDVNPASGNIEGAYGDKHKGSIDNKDSLITDENGFKNIVHLAIGHSPFSEIERRDKEYQEKLKA